MVENSETAGWAFLATGFRTAAAGAAMETFLDGAGEGLMGDNSDGATASSDAFLFKPRYVSVMLYSR